MSQRLIAAVHAAEQAAERVARGPEYPAAIAGMLAGLERRGAIVENLPTQDRGGYQYVVTAKRWSKLLRALARVAIAEGHAFTTVGSDNYPPYYRQELVFERPGRKFFHGLPIDDVRAELIDEINDWEADGAPQHMRFLKSIAVDAGVVKWPAKLRDDSSELQEREYRRVARELRDQVENAAPFQVWHYARERFREFYEPIDKAAKLWVAMTPVR